MAHDLQSIAGTLGMQALREAALGLEQACLTGDAPAVQAGLQAVAAQMRPVLEGLESWAEARPREAAGPA
jgi:HPt (histidine-containing phosphotransfer) domain-containing protein